ncbi:MAG: hypothetical protein ACI9M9_000836 [Flavobacteriaceae bacterium]|jgi:hypothetical protein
MEENAPHQNWFNRNWKWAVPTGGCLLIIILIIIFIGSMILGVSSLFTGSEPYKAALLTAQSSEVAIEALGIPIEENGIAKGSVNYMNGDGHFNLEIPLKGPKGKAVLFVIADKYNGDWEYKVMELEISETGELIPLLTLERHLEN